MVQDPIANLTEKDITKGVIPPPPLPVVPEQKSLKWERIINSFLIAFLAFIVGSMLMTLKTAPDAADAAEEAIIRVVSRDYVNVANQVLLDVVKERGLCDTIEATE